jgi:hypothetical protein
VKRKRKIVKAMLDESLVLKEESYLYRIILVQRVQRVEPSFDVELNPRLKLYCVQEPPASSDDGKAA